MTGLTTDRRRTTKLGGLLGASRARILTDLVAPTSTTQLSDRHGLAVSTVSYHLGVLLDAGLVTRQRNGVVVAYRRTEQGHTLVRQTG